MHGPDARNDPRDRFATTCDRDRATRRAQCPQAREGQPAPALRERPLANPVKRKLETGRPGRASRIPRLPSRTRLRSACDPPRPAATKDDKGPELPTCSRKIDTLAVHEPEDRW
jgi:hypothetical protein